MDNSPLKETLERLHAELERAQPIDDESRELLEHLKEDIQAVLKTPDAASKNSLRKRLDLALAKFEDSHADLVLTIKQVLDHLAEV